MSPPHQKENYECINHTNAGRHILDWRRIARLDSADRSHCRAGPPLIRPPATPRTRAASAGMRIRALSYCALPDPHPGIPKSNASPFSSSDFKLLTTAGHPLLIPLNEFGSAPKSSGNRFS